MSEAGLQAATAKMRAASASDSAIRAFEAAYRQLESGATALIPEDTIEPVDDVMKASAIDVSQTESNNALAHTAVIRLNGGLGTSMGLKQAKTLLKARGIKRSLR